MDNKKTSAAAILQRVGGFYWHLDIPGSLINLDGMLQRGSNCPHTGLLLMASDVMDIFEAKFSDKVLDFVNEFEYFVPKRVGIFSSPTKADKDAPIFIEVDPEGEEKPVYLDTEGKDAPLFLLDSEGSHALIYGEFAGLRYRDVWHSMSNNPAVVHMESDSVDDVIYGIWAVVELP